MNTYTEYAADTTGQIISCAIEVHRPDLVVSDQVVVEVKSVERFSPVFLAQMLTYLRITELSVGLILNFNRSVMVDGVRRVSLRDQEPLRL